MILQKGFGLIILLIALAVVSFIAYGVFYDKENIDEDNSYFEKRVDAVEQAEGIKSTLEQRDKENLNY